MVKKKLSPKKITFKQAYSDYLHGKVNLKPYQKIGITMLIFVIAGFVGWVYEFIFGFFDHGCTEWYMQGGNFLPWINIYAFGALHVVP